MVKRTGFLIGLALVVAIGPQTAGAAPPQLYWADVDLKRSNLAGSSPVTVVSGVTTFAIAVDHAGGKVYWADGAGIHRADRNGPNLNIELNLVPAGGATFTDLALDVKNGKIYWTDDTNDKISRANLNGTAVEDVIVNTVGFPIVQPTGVALDLARGKVYWTDENLNKVARANLDGSSPENVVTSPQPGGVFIAATGIAVDPVRGKIHFSDAGNRIWRANLDGSAATFTTVTDNPQGIALDAAGGKVYWVGLSGAIQRANLDGTAIEPIPTTSTSSAVALDLGPKLVTMFPPSGQVASSMASDLGLILTTTLPVVSGIVTFDGLDITGPFVACGVAGGLLSGGATFRCPGVTAGLYGLGTHTIGVLLLFADGSSTFDLTTLEVIASTP